MAARVKVFPLRLAVMLIRGWTRVYTWRAPGAIGDARRAEIESDLWECQHDPRSNELGSPGHLVARLVLGVPADLLWRLDQIEFRGAVAQRLVAVTAGLLTFLGLWWFSVPRTVSAPSRPASVLIINPMSLLPPPPPPPPSLSRPGRANP
jgi:hypothetical protein